MYQLLGPVTPPSQLLNLQVVLQTPDTILSGDSSLCLGESLESRLVYKRDRVYEYKDNRKPYWLHKKMEGMCSWERDRRGKEEKWVIEKKRGKANASKMAWGWYTPWDEVAMKKNILMGKPKENLSPGKSNLQLKIFPLLKCQPFLDVLRYSTKSTLLMSEWDFCKNWVNFFVSSDRVQNKDSR